MPVYRELFNTPICQFISLLVSSDGGILPSYAAVAIKYTPGALSQFGIMTRFSLLGYCAIRCRLFIGLLCDSCLTAMIISIYLVPPTHASFQQFEWSTQKLS